MTCYESSGWRNMNNLMIFSSVKDKSGVVYAYIVGHIDFYVKILPFFVLILLEMLKKLLIGQFDESTGFLVNKRFIYLLNLKEKRYLH